MFTSLVTVSAIFSSPQHNYFTRPRYEAGDAPTLSHERVRLEPGRGIEGDRFCFGRYPLTFFSLEVAEAVALGLGRSVDPALFRRNIVVHGVNLNELIGREFTLGGVVLRGVSHCAPCTWMDAVLGKGAYRLMQGRGGLRAEVVRGGVLERGELLVETDFPLTRPPAEAAGPRLPKEKTHAAL